MAHFSRADAPPFSTTTTSHPQPRKQYTQTPLFTSMHTGEREEIFTYANRMRRQRKIALEESMSRKANVLSQEDEEELSSVSSFAIEDARPVTSAASGGGARGNWLERREEPVPTRRFGIEEAWKLTDERNAYKTQLQHGIGNGNTGRQSPGSESGSRIPRTKTFSPPKQKSTSPRRSLTDSYHMVERDVRIPSEGSESESSGGQRQGSPSPAARDRRRPQYLNGVTAGRNGSGSGSDISASSHYNHSSRRRVTREEALGNRPYSTDPELVANRLRAAEDSAYIKRRINSDVPLFLGKHGSSSGQRVVETAKTLVRQSYSHNDDVVEPPMHNYKSWGEKAKPRPGWVTNIVSPESSMEVKNLPPPEDVLQAAVDTPLPSVESSFEPTPPSSRPNSAQPAFASPEKSKIWDAELDFTAQSLQISTSPQLRIRHHKLDQLRDREIQNLTARAVATNRLEEIRERNSEERSVLTDSSRVNARDSTPEPTKSQSQEGIYHERTILEEEGEHIANTPITIFSAGSYRPSSSSQNRHGEERPGHKREDSFEVLRRLSRTASTSPAPPRRTETMEEPIVKPVASTLKEEKTTERPSFKDQHESRHTTKLAEDKTKANTLELGAADTKRHSRSSSRPGSEIDPEERITAEAKLFDLPDSKSERNSIRAPSPSPPSSDDDKFDETPRPKTRDPLSLPTPRVMGAFIETPAGSNRKERKRRTFTPYYPVGDDDTTVLIENGVSSADSNDIQESNPTAEPQLGVRRRLQSSARHQELKKSLARPPLINTATPASASEDLKRIKAEAQIEDSTVDDFDGLENEVPDVGNTTTILEPLLDLEYDERGRPISAKERERRLERIILDRMNQHLKNTSSSIRDARQGIERLEHQVSSATPLPPATRSYDQPLCIQIPVPRLWIRNPEPATKSRDGRYFTRNWKFTWLGLILAIFTSWYIAESAMCEVFCHPINTTNKPWHWTDPFFPWAIPTKLDQWTGEVVSTSAYGVWEFVDITLYGPKKGRKKWKPVPTPTGSNEWWAANDKPSTASTESGGSIFDDEVI